MNALASMSDPLVRVVPGDEIAAYRAVAQAAVGTPSAALGASPVLHPFVLARSTFDRAVHDASGGSARAVVHLAQEIRQRRPLGAGERVALDYDIVGARRDRRGVRLALRSTVTGADGAPVAELATALLVVGATAPEPFGTVPCLTGGLGAAGPRTVATVHVPRDLPQRYAEVSGDRNPIHLDRDAARAAGFRDVIAHGMSVLALACNEVVDRYVGGDASRVRGIGCRFSSPVAPGEPLEISLAPDGGGRVRFTGTTPRGTALKNGWVEWVTA
jgi:acyl dehydratase